VLWRITLMRRHSGFVSNLRELPYRRNKRA
jgi:hypothetical protein